MAEEHIEGVGDRLGEMVDDGHEEGVGERLGESEPLGDRDVRAVTMVCVTVPLAQPQGLGDALLETVDVGLAVSATAPTLGVTRCVPSIEYSGESLDSTDGDAEYDERTVMTV